MSSKENHGSLSPLYSFGRSLFGATREQAGSPERGSSREANKPELVECKLFREFVTERFQELADVETEELLSIAWMQKLMKAYISCQDEFKVILMGHKSQIFKLPLEKIVTDFFQRSLTGLDICTATRDGIWRIRSMHKHLDIILGALNSHHRSIGEGQFRRVRKSLKDLKLEMLDAKESGAVPQLNLSSGRHNTSKDQASSSRSGKGCSHSWSVSQYWSAAKTLQSIAKNLNPPSADEIQAMGGLLVPVSTMNYLLVFVLWVLVAAFPCQDRGLEIPYSIPRKYTWGTPLLALYDRILEESKKRERKNSCGLLKEIYQIEKCAQHLEELVNMFKFPLTEDQKTVVEQGKHQPTLICDALTNGLDPLERQLREVFKGLRNCRHEFLDLLGHGRSDQN